MKRLWNMLDDAPPPAIGSLHPVATALIGTALEALCIPIADLLLGVQLPFLCQIGAVLGVTVVAGMAAGLLTTVLNVIFLAALMRYDALPLLTWPNLMFASAFSLVIAISGGVLHRRRAQHLAFSARIERREGLLQSIFDHLPAPIIIVDAEGMIRAINAEGCALFETSADVAFGRHLDTFLVVDRPGQEDLVTTLARASQSASVHALATTNVAQPRQLRLNAAYVPSSNNRWMTVYVRDETETLAAAGRLEVVQRQLLHVTRATALGEMGSAIAHELNQPLAAISNCLGAAQYELARGDFDPARLGDALDVSLKQTLRAGAVLKRLRGFVAQKPETRQLVDASEVVAEAVALSQFTVRDAGVRLSTRIANDLGAVRVDLVQVQQVLLNMIRNAIDAIAGRSDGTVRIEADAGDRDDIVFSVVDNGQGLQPDISARVFEAFATTKSNGLGVGLSISKTIIEAHGGSVGCDENPVGGMRFWFTLPRTAVESSRRAA